MATKFTQIVSERLGDENLTAIARKVGIPKAVLHDWVKGKRLPSVKNIHLVKALADYLGLTLEELLIGSDFQKQEKRIISSVRFSDEDKNYEITIQRINEGGKKGRSK